MGLGRNIAELRKQRGFTQEELGTRLGVTNQAVSKWENETSLPDVMLLPELADALGVTLNALYGIKEIKPEKVRADDFPEAARESLKKFFVEQAGAKMPGGQELGEHIDLLGCVSDTSGTVFLSRDFSFIENTFGMPGSEAVFEHAELIPILKKLTDRNALRVFAYMYRTTFERKASDPGTESWEWACTYTVPAVAADCGLDEDEVLEAVEKLDSLHLIDFKWFHDGVTEYYFSKDYAQFVLVLFRTLEILFTDSRTYALWRDSSKISDYLFEKLWK